MGDNLFEAFPNATRVAFTGTPLITERHGGRQTVKRFGEYIDTYKLMDSVADGATLQILYEGRTANTALEGQGRVRHRSSRTSSRNARLRNCSPSRKSTAPPEISSKRKTASEPSPAIWSTTTSTTSCPNGFKAQVVCHSKLAAVRYQRAIASPAERIERGSVQSRA